MDLKEIGWEECGLDSLDSEYEPVTGSSEHVNEPSYCTKGWKFFR
jgi:hypothetical protein